MIYFNKSSTLQRKAVKTVGGGKYYDQAEQNFMNWIEFIAGRNHILLKATNLSPKVCLWSEFGPHHKTQQIYFIAQ